MAQPEPESLPRRQTDPAWLQDHFLGTGHDEKTRNATVTFVKRHGRHYAVTCRHVASAVENPQMVPGAKFPTVALHMDRTVLNLSGFSAQGHVQAVRSPAAGAKQEEVDIGIAPLDGAGHWHMLTEVKRKAPIDLDQWREPDWTKVKYCLAVGYPDEHKSRVISDGAEKVASPFFSVVAATASGLGRSKRLITLSSTLDKAHGYYFSGMSGGPVYAIEGHEQALVEDEDLFPVGIIFEGFPGSGRPNAQPRSGTNTFLTEKDLFFRALTLTPEFFDEWVRDAGISA
jgi:hypothetical protein